MVNDPLNDPYASWIDKDGVTNLGTTKFTDKTYLWKPTHHMGA